MRAIVCSLYAMLMADASTKNRTQFGAVQQGK
jgi:hypothetical protein